MLSVVAGHPCTHPHPGTRNYLNKRPHASTVFLCASCEAFFLFGGANDMHACDTSVQALPWLPIGEFPWSAYREAQFGHGSFQTYNATVALWTW